MKIMNYFKILLLIFFSLPLSADWTIVNYTGEDVYIKVFYDRGDAEGVVKKSETGSYLSRVHNVFANNQEIPVISGVGTTVKSVGYSDQNLMLYKDGNKYKLMATPGSFSKTCNCIYDGAALRCDCKTKKGSWHHTEIPAAACKSFKNDDGNLKCE